MPPINTGQIGISSDTCTSFTAAPWPNNQSIPARILSGGPFIVGEFDSGRISSFDVTPFNAVEISTLDFLWFSWVRFKAKVKILNPRPNLVIELTFVGMAPGEPLDYLTGKLIYVQFGTCAFVAPPPPALPPPAPPPPTFVEIRETLPTLMISMMDYSNKILFNTGLAIFSQTPTVSYPFKVYTLNNKKYVFVNTRIYELVYMSSSDTRVRNIGIVLLIDIETEERYINFDAWFQKKTFTSAITNPDVPGLTSAGTGIDSFVFDIDVSSGGQSAMLVGNGNGAMFCSVYNNCIGLGVEFVTGEEVPFDKFVQLRLNNEQTWPAPVTKVECGVSHVQFDVYIGARVFPSILTHDIRHRVSSDGNTLIPESRFNTRTLYIYDCQLISGMEGFNCSSQVYDSAIINNIYGNWISVPDETAIPDLVYTYNGCIGFIYDYVNQRIKVISTTQSPAIIGGSSLIDKSDGDAFTHTGQADIMNPSRKYSSSAMKFGTLGSSTLQQRYDNPFPYKYRTSWTVEGAYRTYFRSNMPLGMNLWLGQIDKRLMVCCNFTGSIGKTYNKTVITLSSGSVFNAYRDGDYFFIEHAGGYLSYVAPGGRSFSSTSTLSAINFFTMEDKGGNNLRVTSVIDDTSYVDYTYTNIQFPQYASDPIIQTIGIRKLDAVVYNTTDSNIPDPNLVFRYYKNGILILDRSNVIVSYHTFKSVTGHMLVNNDTGTILRPRRLGSDSMGWGTWNRIRPGCSRPIGLKNPPPRTRTPSDFEQFMDAITPPNTNSAISQALYNFVASTTMEDVAIGIATTGGAALLGLLAKWWRRRRRADDAAEAIGTHVPPVPPSATRLDDTFVRVGPTLQPVRLTFSQATTGYVDDTAETFTATWSRTPSRQIPATPMWDDIPAAGGAAASGSRGPPGGAAGYTGTRHIVMFPGGAQTSTGGSARKAAAEAYAADQLRRTGKATTPQEQIVTSPYQWSGLPP